MSDVFIILRTRIIKISSVLTELFKIKNVLTFLKHAVYICRLYNETFVYILEH